jgi:hypothetical protein
MPWFIDIVGQAPSLRQHTLRPPFRRRAFSHLWHNQCRITGSEMIRENYAASGSQPARKTKQGRRRSASLTACVHPPLLVRSPVCRRDKVMRNFPQPTSEARRLAHIRRHAFFVQLDLSPANRADRFPSARLRKCVT